MQKARTLRNKSKAQARHRELAKVGDRASLKTHLLRNRLKRIARKLKEGTGIDRMNKLRARADGIKQILGAQSQSALASVS